MDKPSYIDILAKYGIGSAHPGGLLLTSELLKMEHITKSTEILDIGCGTGETSAYIAKHYPCSLTAADINYTMLQNAKRRFQNENINAKLVYADACNLPFTSGYFDIVLAESVTVFTKMQKSLSEYSKVLKAGNGVLLDIELTANVPLMPEELRDVNLIMGVSKVPTQNEWCDMLYCAGAVNVKVFYGPMIPSAAPVSYQLMKELIPYLHLMNKYQRKLGYRIYRCNFKS